MKPNLIAIIFGAICLTFLFSACEKEVQLPSQSDPKLVVESYISPQQTSIIVRLSVSRPYYGVAPKIDPSIGTISNATVTISDGSSAVTIPWDGTKKQYILINAQTAFPITAGKTYTLQVAASGYPTLSAQTSIPKPITGVSFKFLGVQKDIERNTNNPFDLYTYKFLVPNTPAPGEYYRFYPTLQVGTPNPLVTSPSNDPAADWVYGDPYLQEYTPSLIGTSERNIGLLKKYTSAPSVGTLLTHTGYFISCSKEYYLFYQTTPVNLGIDPKNSATVENLYSNIKGGYGIFAGYNAVASTINSTY